PGADEIRGDSVEVSVERSTSLVAVTRAPVRIDNFQLGATLGVTVPLNGDSGVGAVQRAGLNGRLQLSQLKGCSVVTGCKSFVLALPRVVFRIEEVRDSGGRSYSEIAWRRSANLDSRGRRRHSVVQLRVPSTEFVFQFVMNNGGRDNPVILSIFTPLALKDIRDIILGKGKG